jgi:spermidine synthase
VTAAFPDAVVEVAELDPAVTAIAEERLFLDPKAMTIVHTDARVALANADAGAYDAIVGDVFHDVAVPFHLTTLEYAELVSSRLAPGGIYVMNVVDVFPDPRLVKSIVRGLAENFRQVDIWLDRIPAARGRATYVISAADTSEPPPVLEARNGLARQWLRVTESVLETGTPVASLPLLSDDFVPVERLVSPLLLETVGN